MIGDLLKQLARDLTRYIRYHVLRIFRREKEVGLDPAYERLVRWPAYRENVPPQEILSDELYQLWTSTHHGHKWTHYFAIYQAVFGPRRADPMRILEIGVLLGSSLRLWKQYFANPETLIVGIDIRPECVEFDAPADGIRVRIGSQADAEFLKSVVKEFGPFDLIIDDGSHHSSHMITSFNHLYSEGLKDNGIYFVEDLHANYWLPCAIRGRVFSTCAKSCSNTCMPTIEDPPLQHSLLTSRPTSR